MSFARITAANAERQASDDRRNVRSAGRITRTRGAAVVEAGPTGNTASQNIPNARPGVCPAGTGFTNNQQQQELEFARFVAASSRFPHRRQWPDTLAGPHPSMGAVSSGRGSLASNMSEMTNDTQERRGGAQIPLGMTNDQFQHHQFARPGANNSIPLLHQLQQMQGMQVSNRFPAHNFHQNGQGYVNPPPPFGYHLMPHGIVKHVNYADRFYVERQASPGDNSGDGSGGSAGRSAEAGSGGGSKVATRKTQMVLTKSSAAVMSDVDGNESALATKVALGVEHFQKVQRMMLRQQHEFEHQLMELHRLTKLMRSVVPGWTTTDRSSPENENAHKDHAQVLVNRASPDSDHVNDNGSDGHATWSDGQQGSGGERGSGGSGQGAGPDKAQGSDPNTVSDAPPASAEVKQAARIAFEEQKQRQQRAYAIAMRPWREEGGADYRPADYGAEGGTTTLMGPGGAAAASMRTKHADAAMVIAQRQHAVHNASVLPPPLVQHGGHHSASKQYGAHLNAHEQWTQWYMSAYNAHAANQQGGSGVFRGQQGMPHPLGMSIPSNGVAKNGPGQKPTQAGQHVINTPTATHALFSSTAEEVTQNVGPHSVSQHHHQGRHHHFSVPQHPGAPYAFPAYPGSGSQGPTPRGVTAVGYQPPYPRFVPNPVVAVVPSVKHLNAATQPVFASSQQPETKIQTVPDPRDAANELKRKRREDTDVDDAGSDSIMTGQVGSVHENAVTGNEVREEQQGVFGSTVVPKKSRSGRERKQTNQDGDTRPKKDQSAADILVSIANA